MGPQLRARDFRPVRNKGQWKKLKEEQSRCEFKEAVAALQMIPWTRAVYSGTDTMTLVPMCLLGRMGDTGEAEELALKGDRC